MNNYNAYCRRCMAGIFVGSLLFGVVSTALHATGNELVNSSFEHGDTPADLSAWHRVKGEGVSYLARPDDWVIDRFEAWDGHRSLRSQGGGALYIPSEVWNIHQPNNPWAFSLAIKADRAGVPVKLRVGEYPGGFRQGYAELEITAGTEWERFSVTAENFRGARRSIHGPVNFWIEPVDSEATIWVDALQWAPQGDSGEYAPSSHDVQTFDVRDFKFLQGMPWNPILPPEGGAAIGSRGRVALVVDSPAGGALEKTPVKGGILFPEGTWDGRGAVRLSRNGFPVAVQHEILATWPADGSVQSLGLAFETSLTAGQSEFVLDYGLNEIPDEAPSLLQVRSPRHWVVELDTVDVQIDRSDGRLWHAIVDRQTGERIFDEAFVTAFDLQGRDYNSVRTRVVETKVESEGPLYVAISTRGMLTSDAGAVIAMYIARLHFWKHSPGVEVELTLVNSMNHGKVGLREAYWQTGFSGLKAGGVAGFSKESEPIRGQHAVLQYFDFGNTMTSLPGGDIRFPEGHWGRMLLKGESVTDAVDQRDEVWVAGQGGDSGFFLHTRHGWQRHPTMLGVDERGLIKGYLWPSDPVRGVYLSRGMALTREFALIQTPGDIIGEAAQPLVDHYKAKPLLMMAPDWFVKTDPLLPVGARNKEDFPQLEAFLQSETALGRLAQSSKEANHKYGLFDYGDKHSHHGDGWINLESFLDQSLIIRGMRNSEPDILRQGLISAEHYRDIDINQTEGYAYIHNVGHSLGGGPNERLPRQNRWSLATPKRFDHSWPQGVILHYLLTGSRQSRDTIVRVGEFMLDAPVDDWGFLEMGRMLGRYLQNVADIYQVTGDERYRERFFEQIAHSEKVLEKNREHPTASFFLVFPRPSWSPAEEVPPFFAWYGLLSLTKMYGMTGEASLPDHIRRELHFSVYQKRFEERGLQLWPNASNKEALAIQMGDYIGEYGRNYTLFSVMDSVKKLGIYTDHPEEYKRLEDVTIDAFFLSLAIGKMNHLRPNSALARNQASVLASVIPGGLGRDLNEADGIRRAQDILWRGAEADFSSIAGSDLITRGMKLQAIPSGNPETKGLSFQADIEARSAQVETPRVRVVAGESILSGSVRTIPDKGELRLRLSFWALPDGEFGTRRDPSFDLRFNPESQQLELERNQTDLNISEMNSVYDATADIWQFRVRIESEHRGVMGLTFRTLLPDGTTHGALTVEDVNFRADY